MLGLRWVAHKVVTSSRLQSPKICSIKGEKIDIFTCYCQKVYTVVAE